MYLMRTLVIGASRKIEFSLRENIYKKFLYLPSTFYQKEKTGDLISRTVNDIDEVRTLCGPGVMYIPNSLTRLGFFIPIMYQLSAKILFFISIQMILLITIMLFLMPRLKPFMKKIQITKGKINNFAWEILTGINTIKVNTLEKFKEKKFDTLNKKYIRENVNLATFNAFTWPLFIFIFSLSEVVFLWVGGREIIAGKMTIGEFLQFNVMTIFVAFPIFSLGWIMSMVQYGLVASERIGKILNYPNEKSLKKQIHTLRLADSLDIKIENISFNYEIDHEHSNTTVIDNFSLLIPFGELLGITGKTGSGKTTLLELISRLQHVKSGSIRIADKEIESIKYQSLYSQISVISQETFLFSTTVANNIGFQEDGNISLERVKSCAQIADIDKDIQTFPNQYNTIIGERGITLSGGQKQRISIARALYANANILLFDDSFSSVDVHTSENIINNLRQLKKKTIIIVSHKISSLKLMDRILYVENGEIIEEGSHNTLITKNEKYAKLAKIQKLETEIEMIE